MRRTPSTVIAPGPPGQPDVHVGTLEHLIRGTLGSLRVRPLGVRALHRIETGPFPPRGTGFHPAIAPPMTLRAPASRSRSVVAIPAAPPPPGDDDLHVLEGFADDLERVHERRQHDDRGAVLVVVEHGNVELVP